MTSVVDLLGMVGVTLVLLGVILVVLTLFLSLCRTRFQGGTKGAGAIIVGPIPIIFGTDKGSLKIILTMSIILTAIVLVIFLLMVQTSSA